MNSKHKYLQNLQLMFEACSRYEQGSAIKEEDGTFSRSKALNGLRDWPRVVM